jgi:hypothetical protein
MAQATLHHCREAAVRRDKIRRAISNLAAL